MLKDDKLNIILDDIINTIKNIKDRNFKDVDIIKLKNICSDIGLSDIEVSDTHLESLMTAKDISKEEAKKEVLTQLDAVFVNIIVALMPLHAMLYIEHQIKDIEEKSEELKKILNENN